jgi:hypothetical protein
LAGTLELTISLHLFTVTVSKFNNNKYYNMKVKNVSGETRYFGFGQGTKIRGFALAHNAEKVIPDTDAAYAIARDYVKKGIMQITEGPESATLASSIVTPAFGVVAATGAVANTNTVTVGGQVYEFLADPGAGVLGQHVVGLADAANVWAGAGAAAATAMGTLRTAINAHSATSGVTAAAPYTYDTGMVALVITRNDQSPAIGTTNLAKNGANIVVSGAALTPGVIGSAMSMFAKTHTVVAADVALGAVVVPTGLTTIAQHLVKVTTAAGIAYDWNGAIHITGGTLYYNNTGATDFQAGDVLTILAWGK